MRPFCVVESRFKGGDGWTEAENLMAARFYCRRATEYGYNPVASHLFYPQFLADNDPRERALGIAARAGPIPFQRPGPLVTQGQNESPPVPSWREMGLQMAAAVRPEIVWFCVRVNARGRREKLSEGMEAAKKFWEHRSVPTELWVCRPGRSGEPELILSTWEEQEDDGYGLRII